MYVYAIAITTINEQMQTICWYEILFRNAFIAEINQQNKNNHSNAKKKGEKFFKPATSCTSHTCNSWQTRVGSPGRKGWQWREGDEQLVELVEVLTHWLLLFKEKEKV